MVRRSVSGYVVMLGGGPVCWQSKQQKSASTSTAEAEYVGLSEASKQAIWTIGLLRELHIGNVFTSNNGLLTLSNNQSAISIAGGRQRRSLHLPVVMV